MPQTIELFNKELDLNEAVKEIKDEFAQKSFLQELGVKLVLQKILKTLRLMAEMMRQIRNCYKYSFLRKV